MDSIRKQEILSETRFLRGFYYSYLMWFFGGVPLTTSTTDSQLLPRSNIENVSALIISDLKYAYSTLPDRNSYEISMVNKYTAGTMLAKMYLYLASCAENNVGKN